MKILHVGDLHVVAGDDREQDALFEEIIHRASLADLVFFGGDMTHLGAPSEYRRVHEYLEPIKDKVVLIRGNHDNGFFMDEFGDLIAETASDIHFDVNDFPMHEWKAGRWESIEAQAKPFNRNRQLLPPYDMNSQPEIVKLIDGTGPYYYFEKKGWRFIVLDTCSWLLGAKQLTFLKDALNYSGVPTLVFIHHAMLPVGSIYDGAALWDNEAFMDLVLDAPCVKGVFSGHVHYNRIWNLDGMKVVTTADRGGIRSITLGDGEIEQMEHLGNYYKPGSGAVPPCDLNNQGSGPFRLKYWSAGGVLSPNSFLCSDNGIWSLHPTVSDYNCLGWVEEKSSAGVTWNIPVLDSGNSSQWFGLNFSTTSKWKVTVKVGGETVYEKKGSPGDSVVVSGHLESLGLAKHVIKLEELAPAKGHASPFIVFNDKPVESFNRYP